MKLIDHLKATEDTVEAFARRLGMAKSTITKIAYGQRQPSLPLAVRIEQATAGKVTCADMLLAEDVAA